MSQSKERMNLYKGSEPEITVCGRIPRVERSWNLCVVHYCLWSSLNWSLFYIKNKDRIAGATTEINSLKDAYNRGEYPIRESTDIHAICDLVKSWFRVLPEPVFPPSSYHDVMDAMSEFELWFPSLPFFPKGFHFVLLYFKSAFSFSFSINDQTINQNSKYFTIVLSKIKIPFKGLLYLIIHPDV